MKNNRTPNRTPSNKTAGETFTASINNLMSAERNSCQYADRALTLFAASGNSAEYRAARQHFANAYAARAEKSFRLTLLVFALGNLALFAALYMGR